LIAGLVIASISIKETLIATITDKEIQLDKDGHRQTIAGKEVEAIFLDRKQLVILGQTGEELAREKIDEYPKNFQYGFERHGYSWLPDGDPFKDVYRRWVPNTPDISPSANAVMKAREKALQEKDI